jgi:hypothetical protein
MFQCTSTDQKCCFRLKIGASDDFRKLYDCVINKSSEAAKSYIGQVTKNTNTLEMFLDVCQIVLLGIDRSHMVQVGSAVRSTKLMHLTDLGSG